METKGWIIDSFEFHYKNQNYIVLVILCSEKETKPDYALLKLEFLKQNDFSDSLLVHANSAKLFIDTKTLRTYFNIEFSDNLGNILQQFSLELANSIPTEVIQNKPVQQKEAMLTSLNKSDPEDPRKKYCYAVRRNSDRADGSPGQRGDFNDNKTRLRRTTLYDKLGIDPNLSFLYSTNKEDENTDEVIIYNWTKNK